MCCYDICRSFAWGRWNSGSQWDRHERQKHQWCLWLTGMYQFHLCHKVIWPCKEAGPLSNQYLVLSRMLIVLIESFKLQILLSWESGERNLCHAHLTPPPNYFFCFGKRKKNSSLMNDFFFKRLKGYILKILSIICALHKNDLWAGHSSKYLLS